MDPRYSGRDLSSMFLGAIDSIRAHEDELNRMNVFPVPDSDTGTNMRQTLEAVGNDLGEDIAAEPAFRVAERVARAAVIGARGNSGVMLAQLLRGFSRGLGGLETFSATEFSRALSDASDLLHRTVPDPVEGTILTVVRYSAQAAAAAPQRFLHEVLERAVRAADEAVELTPDLLPVLREAGVTDAGGKGFFYILEGMAERHGAPSQR